MIFGENSARNNAVFGAWQAPLRKILVDSEEAWKQKSLVDRIFCMETSTHHAEAYGSMASMTDFEPVGEGGPMPHGDTQQSHIKTIQNVTWRNGFAITSEMVEDAQLRDFKKKPELMVGSYYRTRERFAAAMLGGAISGKNEVTYGAWRFDARAADKLTLFHKEHENLLDGKKQSNLFENELTEDSLGAAESYMQNLTDDTGNVIGLAPTTLVIPNDHNLKKAAFAAIGSDQVPGDSNNDFNYHYGRWNLVIWPYLNQFIKAGVKPWLLLDDDFNEEEGTLIFQTRRELTMRSWIDQNTEANMWGGSARFTAGFNNWRGVCCGGITGGTVL